LNSIPGRFSASDRERKENNESGQKSVIVHCA